MRRTPRLIAQADPDLMKLVLVCDGAAVVEQGGRQARLSAGLGDLTSQFLLQLADNVDHYSPAEAARLSSAGLEVLGTRLAHELDASGWFVDALAKAGIETRMGPRLHAAFRAAGLPGPRMLVESFVGGGPDAPAWGWANVVAGAVPLMERLGVATRAEVDPATLADRLLAETLASDGCMICPPMTGAWATVPAA